MIWVPRVPEHPLYAGEPGGEPVPLRVRLRPQLVDLAQAPGPHLHTPANDVPPLGQPCTIKNNSDSVLIRAMDRRHSVSATKFQSCGSGSRSGSELDPNSMGSLDPYPDSQPGSGSRRAKMTHKSRKNLEISCFEVLDVPRLRPEAFFCSLDVLYGGLGIIYLHCLFKKRKKFQLFFSSSIFAHQNPGTTSLLNSRSKVASFCRKIWLLRICKKPNLAQYAVQYRYMGSSFC